MSAQFDGEGHLAEAPELRYVLVKGEKVPVANLRLRCDRLVPNPSKEANAPAFVDSGGFWVTGVVWGKMAEQCARLLVKGARIRVSGVMFQETYTDKAGVEKTVLKITVERVSLALGKIESVVFKPKAALPGSGKASAIDEDDFGGIPDGDIPEDAFTA